MLKTTQVTKTAPFLPFLYRAAVFGQMAPIFAFSLPRNSVFALMQT
jgi:hypothetical protein